jgi:glycosyltransferase involved in cell wall biosynthesis
VLREKIRESSPDVVISFMEGSNVLTLLATRWLRLPVIVIEQTDPALYEIGRAWNILRRMVYPLADYLVCPVAGSLARFQSMTRVRGCVIPNPIDVPSLPQNAGQRSGEGHTLAAMGRLVYQKGFDLLLRAFAEICGRHPDWRLVIYGSGPLLEELQAQALGLEVHERVHFAGAVSDPFAQLQAADMFVLSSRFEGFGMALAEAMACGLPAVSFDCPEGPACIIRNGVDGILVPPGDVESLATVLDRLMGDAQERRKLGLGAVEVRERFSTEKILSQWQELFNTLLAPAGTTVVRKSVSIS